MKKPKKGQTIFIKWRVGEKICKKPVKVKGFRKDDCYVVDEVAGNFAYWINYLNTSKGLFWLASR